MWRKIILVLVSLSVLGMSASAKDETWLVINSPHFLVVSDSGEGQARHIADQLEQMRALFLSMFPKVNADSSSSTLVLAVRDKKDFRLLEPKAYLAKGQLDLAGLFIQRPDKNYILVRLDTDSEHPYEGVYHEYTHFLLRNDAEWLPLWLNEGLAEFFQNTEIHGKEAMLGEPSSDDILYLRGHSLLPLATLFRVDYASPYYHEEEKGSVFYAESWALVHYSEITDRTQHLNRLADYGRRVSQKEDPVIAAQEAFGDLTKLQKALEAYVSQNSFQQLQVPAPTPADAASFVSHPLSLPQANAYRADFLAYNGRTQDARAELDGVLREDPDNVLAHETMGFLEFQRGDLGSARNWYAQAVRLDSQDFMAQYNFAAMSMRAGNLSPQDQAQVESSLRAAIKLNPGYAPAYDWLSGFYMMRHENLDQARLLAVQAVELDPGNVVYRVNAAALLLEMGQTTGARDALHTALAVAKTPQQTKLVENRLTQLESRARAQDAAPASQVSAPAGQVSAPGAVHANQVTLVMPQQAPRHPDETPHGSMHIADGIVRSAQCFSPSTLEIKIAVGPASVMSLYSNNYFKVEFLAANFTPRGDLNPCKDLSGMKARVKYSDTSDKTMDGQLVTVTVSK